MHAGAKLGLTAGAAFPARTVRRGASQFASDYGGSAADSGGHTQGRRGAIPGTGAALHAGCPVGDDGLPVYNGKHPVGADIDTGTAAGAGGRIKGEACAVFQIVPAFCGRPPVQASHAKPPRPVMTANKPRTRPEARARTWGSMALSTSYRAPDWEVKVLAPVKFIAR